MRGRSQTNHHTYPMNLSKEELTTLAIALAIVYGVYRFVPNASVKAAALGVGGVLVARQLPYVGDAF